VIDSQFGLLNAVQRPQVTTLGREAYPTFPDKVAAFIFALLTARPFRGGNRRLALASLLAFCGSIVQSSPITAQFVSANSGKI